MNPVRDDARDDQQRHEPAVPGRPGEVDVIPLVTMAVAIACPLCDQPFSPAGRQRFCSQACRQAAYRRRHDQPRVASLPMPGPTKPFTVYECPSCETRYVGEQRCEDCNLFCRRLGPGGLCPHCSEPVAALELVDLP